MPRSSGKNRTYEYRYSDGHGKVQSVYGKTLESLRKKEKTIQRDMADGIDYATGEITVSELVDRYMNLKRDLSENTRRGYVTVHITMMILRFCWGQDFTSASFTV